MTECRAPQELFDGFEGATEEQKGDLRQRVIDWLLAQPKRADVTYIIPEPETGDEMHLRHPGLQ